MIEFKFDKKKISLPTEWQEVTVEMFINPLFLSGKSISLLSSLSGIGEEQLLNTTEDLMPHYKKVVKFLEDEPDGWKGGEVPKTLTIEGKEYVIPTDIELQMFGQKVMLGEALGKNKDNPLNTIPEAIAIYLAPKVYDKDWHEHIEELTEKILKLSIRDVYPIADFFLPTIRMSATSGSKD